LPAKVKFDEFELDCHRYQLLRAGRRIRLEKLPMELLILLLENEGHLVTREEIVDRLWGKDVFLDTQHGINTAIRKIRKALRDDPEQPRFVLTVTGKGYRFVRPADESDGRLSGHPANGNGSRNGTGSAVTPNNGVQNALALVDQPVPEDGHDVEFVNINCNGDANASPGVFNRSIAPVREVAGSRLELEAKHKKPMWISLLPVLGLLLAGAGLLYWRMTRTRVVEWASSATRLTTNPIDIPISAAVLSPNGQSLVYSDERGMWLRELRSGEVHQIALPKGFVAKPRAWLPDNTHLLVVSSMTGGGPPSIWSLSILGGSPREVATRASEVGVSRDGLQIAVTGEQVDRGIRVLDVDGTNVTTVHEVPFRQTIAAKDLGLSLKAIESEI
jgi:DNA-binding winged helix-turn-helix (wHTH) protein